MNIFDIVKPKLMFFIRNGFCNIQESAEEEGSENILKSESNEENVALDF
jgi:hypothetical protein